MRHGILFAALIGFIGFTTIARTDVTTAPSSRWPMMTTASNGAQVTIFQPQLDDFQGDQLSAHAAVAVQMPGAAQPTYGAIWLQSQVSIDRAARTVQVIQVTIPRSTIPGYDAPTTQAFTDAIQQALMASPATLSLDQLLEMLQAVQTAQQQATDLQNNPPRIIFLQHPAVKVQYDGAPRLMEVANSNLLRAVNTPFFVVLDPTTKTYYLKGAGRWFSGPDAMGPFGLSAGAPPNIVDLANQSGYADPAQPVSDVTAQALEIVVATDPTELIWTDGAAQLTPISGTNLLYYSNTESDVFRSISTQQLYVLLSGRWYSGPNENGPWAYVAPNQLPADFAQIPPGSPKANVLAFVPGTQAAQDATADTYIPQTAAIDTNNYQQPPVDYDGDPDFVPIQGTALTYADNCQTPVVCCAGTYYCCSNAVWYQCATPRGRWDLCRRVPPAIYTIPPSCAIYPVRYCYVYGYTPTAVYCGYTPGYTGCYATGGVVVYGTGYYYNAWVGNTYIPRPLTFGFSARYDPYSGHWGFGFALATGGGGLWVGYSPQVVVGGAWFGYGGYRPTLLRGNAHPDFRTQSPPRITARADVYARNLYQDRRDVRAYVPPQRPVQQVRPANPDIGRQDIYADGNGQIYRHTQDGWQSRQGDQWQSAPVAAPDRSQPRQPQAQPQDQPRQPQQDQPRQPAPANPDRGRSPDMGQLDRDRTARQQGDQRGNSGWSPGGRDSGGRDSGGGGQRR